METRIGRYCWSGFDWSWDICYLLGLDGVYVERALEFWEEELIGFISLGPSIGMNYVFLGLMKTLDGCSGRSFSPEHPHGFQSFQALKASGFC